MMYISCNKIKQMTKWMFPQMMFFFNILYGTFSVKAIV